MNRTRKLAGSVLFIMVVMCNQLLGQQEKKLYDPSIDGMKQINEAVAKAKSAGKHVLIQYGGNWCPWCLRFDAFCKADAEISKIISDNYIPVKLNYSPENKNDASNAFLGNPSRFGFPVFIILDGNGKVLHIQDSGLMESGQSYDQKKVTGFMKNWTAAAIIPKKQ
jgi:thioredoxin-related protein